MFRDIQDLGGCRAPGTFSQGDFWLRFRSKVQCVETGRNSLSGGVGDCKHWKLVETLLIWEFPKIIRGP